MKINKRIIYVIGGLAILAFTGMHVATRVAAPVDTAPAGETSATSTFVPSFESHGSASPTAFDGSGKTITTGLSTVPAPKNYSRPLTYSADLSANDRALIDAQFQKDIESIKTTNDIEAWADLAALRKITGDYAGAVEIYLYVSSQHPQLPAPYLSLGHIYANYLKDYPKAEKNLLTAISIAPKSYDAYVELHLMYKGAYPVSPTAAADILKKGISANPSMYQLQIDLARYYAGAGRTMEAKVQYDAAIANAKAQSFAGVASQLEAEKRAL